MEAMCRVSYWDGMSSGCNVRNIDASTWKNFNLFLAVQKTESFLNTKSDYKDGALINQPNKIAMTLQVHTVPASCAVLPTMPCVCCVLWKAVEWVLHVDVHEE